MNDTDLRTTLAEKLAAFNQVEGASRPFSPARPSQRQAAPATFRAAALDFFRALGYASARTLDTGGAPNAFRATFDKGSHLDHPSALVSDWHSAHLLFQLTDDELSGELFLFDAATAVERTRYNSYIFLAIELSGPHYPRTALAAITRRLNRVFPQPVMVLFKTDATVTLTVINRRPNKLNDAKDVLGKVTLIRDIAPAAPHRGHLDILASLAVPSLSSSVRGVHAAITSFDTLHAAWEKLFNVQLLNKSFYNRLSAWYSDCLADIHINLTAASRTLGKDIDSELKPQAVIRVIIRMLFIWFMKEKGLIDARLFTREFAAEFVGKKDGYYNAILQNLFFAVLNKKITERRFRKEDPSNKYDPEKNDYGILDTFRHKKFFKPGKVDAFLRETKTIPFINGGLFVCHDYKFSGKDAATNERNAKGNYIIDGFSDNPKDRATISDAVIFELFDLFRDYVFTIEESTPTEQDIALDPELLGTVFENLIGSYNPETKENARKQTGSFYTPREIVDYMCRESLKQRLITSLSSSSAAVHGGISSHAGGVHAAITSLIDNHEDQLNFPEKTAVIAAITNLKILDPACGSGAFPMGLFLLMVRTIEKLQEHKTTYQNKLDIITNCIYGVDIQNIAIEITKLRFFISLLVDYPAPDKPENFEVLPNLETKFVVANTLVGVDVEIEILTDKAAFAELTTIFLPFTTAKTPKEKPPRQPPQQHPPLPRRLEETPHSRHPPRSPSPHCRPR
jgi:type I restriction-modification system DNA methylase subunit